MVTRGRVRETRKRESQREGSYFCGGFGRGDGVKSLESDSKELGKREWICPCGTKVKRLKRRGDYIKRESNIKAKNMTQNWTVTLGFFPLSLFFFLILFLKFVSVKAHEKSSHTQRPSIRCDAKWTLCTESITPSSFIPSDTSFSPCTSTANQQIKTMWVIWTPTAQWNTYIGVECFTGWLCVQQHLSLNTTDPQALFVFKHLLSKD